MNPPSPRDRSEREALDSVMAGIRDEWGFARSFDLGDLLKKWQTFVAGVENGYQLSIHDYEHDLSMRDLIEEVKDAVPLRLRQEIEAAIAPLDDRLSQATWLSEKPIAPPVEEGAGEWWFRIPHIAGSELRKNLLERGVLLR